ncbi:hypothetical protein SNE40_006815 [Patella caerulea]|uniref:Uncharacterized protein n=1 Tax=Patella caerulea TaxID=87958 RepID=A0AAN8PWK2_PATCE
MGKKKGSSSYYNVKQNQNDDISDDANPFNDDPERVHRYSLRKASRAENTSIAVSTLPISTFVPDYMNLAIFATVCCCLPIGVFAIKRNKEARRLKESGDILGAQKKAASAKRLSIWGMVVGFIFLGVVIGVGVGIYLEHKHIPHHYYGR